MLRASAAIPPGFISRGHSSGAHLAGCVLLTDWAARGLPDDVIKGALLISGMYDLHAPLLSARSRYVKITPEEEAAASAMRQLGRVRLSGGRCVVGGR